MSKKQLLTESEIRRFMKLANLEPLAKNVVRESYAQQDESMPTLPTMEEAGLSGDDSPPEAIKPAMDAPEEGGEDTGDALKKLSPETKEKVMQLIAADLGVDASELDLELGGEGEEDMDMEMSDEDEGEGEEDEEEEEEEKDEMDETLSEDALVETVLARVTARLVSEAAKAKKGDDKKSKKGKVPPQLQATMKKKQQEKDEKKKKALEEATSAEGGGPLLKQGKNKYDVYKGHADMTMAKGDKGGKGGHSLETLSAKAEHTVTHGGKNLATLGGNKKKV
jgi:hypothetical protein